MGLLRSLFLVFLILVLFYIPVSVAAALVSQSKDALSSDVLCLLILLAFANQAFNWIIYGALNRNFRYGYRRLYQGCVDRINACF
jgi:hypothetical protein